MSDQAAQGILSGYLRDKRLSKALPWINGHVLDWGCGSGKLAGSVNSAFYYGFDISDTALEAAKDAYPNHLFNTYLPEQLASFDCVVMLALIEHIKDPVKLLIQVRQFLKKSSTSKVILTTPHPSMEFIHKSGANIGLFSKDANDEHEALINKKRMRQIAQNAAFEMVHYERFLMGANQLIILKPLF